MPRARRRHHSRSRSRSHSHDRDREPKRRRVESPDSSHHRRSVSADNEVTPQKSMSPAQKKLDSAKKREERQKEKEEREKKRQEEKQKQKQEKEEQRLREKKEKEEQKKKEKEEKEEQKRKEREEKEEQKRKEREEKEEQKRKDREEKEEVKRKEKEEKEQKRKEKEEKEEQKRKEREQKELKKQQELEEKEKDKKRKEEQKIKEQAAFVNFFVPRKSAGGVELKKPEEEKASYAFMPFEIKSDMRVAPVTRTALSDEQKNNLIDKITQQMDTLLYLDEIKKGKTLGTSSRTWPVEDDDIIVIEDTGIGECMEEQPKVERMRAKMLKFHENRRPAYFGTWRKQSKNITPRKPLALDKTLFDYEVDSDDDWEEEEPGESLHGSDDEDKENEPEGDDYEVDNEFFVPHGYLSDEEGEAEENVALTPETQKEKLKLLQIEFDEEMKSKTERMKARLIGCIWDKKIVTKMQDAIDKFLEDRMMIVSGSITIQKRDLLNTSVKLSASKQVTPNRKQLTKELIPDFIQLIHGNTNNQMFLVNEFMNYLSNKKTDVSVSKSSLCSQLKRLAKWKKCPEAGPMFNKHCWYVPEEVRNQHNLNLDLPNKWDYTTSGNDEQGARKKLIV